MDSSLFSLVLQDEIQPFHFTPDKTGGRWEGVSSGTSCGQHEVMRMLPPAYGGYRSAAPLHARSEIDTTMSQLTGDLRIPQCHRDFPLLSQEEKLLLFFLIWYV